MISSDELERVADVMRTVGVRWAVAGGWAIDLWLGEQSRAHHDVEVVVGRVDAATVWDALHDAFELACIDPPGSGWRPWVRTNPVAPPAFQCKAHHASLEFDIFLESTDTETWIFRRDGRVRRPLDRLAATRGGLPIVVPEVQLLYMAKSTEPKNERDFDVTHARLDGASKAWLRESLALVHPGHRWIARLAEGPPA